MTHGTTVGKIVLVGAPNVGKSLLFHRLTGAYVTVSNYPGTTVEITRGRLRVSEPHPQPLSVDGEGCRRQVEVCELLDTPGLRSLPLTLQLLRLGPPVVLAINMIDEARARLTDRSRRAAASPANPRSAHRRGARRRHQRTAPTDGASGDSAAALPQIEQRFAEDFHARPLGVRL